MEKSSSKLSRTESLTKDLKDALLGAAPSLLKFEVRDVAEEAKSDADGDPDSMKPFVCNICTHAFLSESFHSYSVLL